MNDSESTCNDLFASGPEAPAARAPDVPARLGRYRIAAKLGEGGSGVVYRGYDDDLRRDVAVKVSHPRRVASPADAETYLAEARVLAGLHHPGIVPVYDLGRSDEGLCYVVSRFVEGQDLAARLGRGRPPLAEAVEIVACVAEALHYSHMQGVVHRDVKPGNILLDARGRPVVADFGLALSDKDFGTGPQFAGTPAYMSPEQARGEGHRVDARSDVYSLGVVFYELLTGQRPFHIVAPQDLIAFFQARDPRPPRQLDDTIPRELDRICLKAIARRAADRYSTALDFAEDLRHWQRQPAARAADQPDVAAPPEAEAPAKVVPRGLRAFDAGDADFFLDLLPGPRDRDGLPESIRFWKTRIEETDADKTFAVGLLYGPSGCGKSSLVKAGLLPRLAGQVAAVYVEATPGDTEARLLKGLRKHCPDLAPELGLAAALAAVRRGKGGRKVLLVLDQFEQWLHARRAEEDTELLRTLRQCDLTLADLAPAYAFADTELVKALRQCDGERVQALVLVRDDFWLAVSRFMAALEVELLQGQNLALADLFDPPHARTVLAAFGRSFGRLPPAPAPPTAEQEAFLDQAVAGLAQDGRVISVRLALFAEMVKGRPWTPATWKTLGGAEGVGVAFLEETFGSTASPPHRLHEPAARAALRALLPERGSEIKGHVRSEEELCRACGYGRRPCDWQQLLHILDGELRLVTPTDPEGQTSDGAAGGRYYQLTHDYLVPALREWLTRKQRETRRGRAELRLGERTAAWQMKRENRHLPAWWEWLNIRLNTRKKDWTEPQRKMMRRAGRYHSAWAAFLAAGLVTLAFLGLRIRDRVVDSNRQTHAAGLVRRLLDADISGVPEAVRAVEGQRRWTEPLLREVLAEAAEDPPRRLRASVALLRLDAGQAEYLYGRLLDAAPAEVPVLVAALRPHLPGWRERLWEVAEQPEKGREARRLRAACALAACDADSPRWEQAGPAVVARLVAENSLHHGLWVEGFRPVKDKLVRPLGALYRDHGEGHGSERTVATNILAEYADRPEDLADLVLDADTRQFALLYPKLAAHGEAARALLHAELERRVPAAGVEADKEQLAQRQANAAAALLRLGEAERVWPLLRHQPDPRLRTYVIHRLSPLGADPRAIVQRLGEEREVSIRRALLLCLGEFGTEVLPPANRERLMLELERLYRNDPDPGLHAAAGWLLRRWGQGARMAAIDEELATGAAEGGRRWYVGKQGQTFVLVEGGEFVMGSPPTEEEREDGPEGRIETAHRRRIGRIFALAAHEVTVAQFLRFRKDCKYSKEYSPTPGHPINGVSWYEAAEYCNWLSAQEGIPQEEWCYEPNPNGDFAEGMRPRPGFPERGGYRLPTEAEWEYACRAGAVTSRPFGASRQPEILGHYACYTRNSQDENMLPAGSLKPNDFGLFDMLGNAFEWVEDPMALYPTPGGSVVEDIGDIKIIIDRLPRVLRGGAFANRSALLRSANRGRLAPAERFGFNGFRPARTIR